MKSNRENMQSAFTVLSHDCRRSGLALLVLLLLLFWPAASANAQSASAPPAQTSAPAQAAPQRARPKLKKITPKQNVFIPATIWRTYMERFPR